MGWKSRAPALFMRAMPVTGPVNRSCHQETVLCLRKAATQKKSGKHLEWYNIFLKGNYTFTTMMHDRLRRIFARELLHEISEGGGVLLSDCIIQARSEIISHPKGCEGAQPNYTLVPALNEKFFG